MCSSEALPASSLGAEVRQETYSGKADLTDWHIRFNKRLLAPPSDTGRNMCPHLLPLNLIGSGLSASKGTDSYNVLRHQTINIPKFITEKSQKTCSA